jgi:hypothetical protein
MSIQSTICFYIQNVPYFTTTQFFSMPMHDLVHMSSRWSMTATFLQITWGYTGHQWETATWYNWHNIILRIWICSRGLFQQVTIIQFMQDIPFPFRFSRLSNIGENCGQPMETSPHHHTLTPNKVFFFPPSSYSLLTPYIHCTKTLTIMLHDSISKTTTILYTSNYVFGHTCTAKHYKLIWMTKQQQAL